MTELETVDEIISLEKVNFGNALRNAREKKGLSLADIATELRLDENIIYAIENHNLDKLPEPAYICGYIRNYARFMNIDPEPMLTSFKQESTLKSNLSSINTIGRSLDKKHDKRIVSFIIFLVLLLALGGFLGWQFLGVKSIDILSGIKSSNTPDISGEQQAKNTTADNGLQFINSSENNIQEDKIVTEKQQTGVVNQVEDSVTASEEAKVTDIENSTTAMQNPPNNDTNVLPTEQPSDTEQETEPVQIEKTQLKKTLTFKFNKNSWVSVKDVKEKSLVYDLKRKGESLVISGIAPMSVFLGDGTGVELLVDNKVYNFTASINSKNIAKFTIQ